MIVIGVKATIDEIGEQLPRERRVLGRAFPQAERDLHPLGCDPERDDMGPLGDLQPVQHHHRQPNVIEPTAHQLLQISAGPLDEHLRHPLCVTTCEPDTFFMAAPPVLSDSV